MTEEENNLDTSVSENNQNANLESATSSSEIDPGGLDLVSRNEVEEVEDAASTILEGDASEICRKKPSTNEMEIGEPRVKRRRIPDDDDDDFFHDFIDDDVAYENVDEKQVWLDAYNADLNLKILPQNRLIAEPLHEDGFAYMMAGVRASYGVNRGRVGFEVKVLENLDISQAKPEETHVPHELRVGWSTDTALLQLGESHYGYGYCSSTGKKVTQWRFATYAEPFEDVGDVVGCLVDFEIKQIEFTKNGQRMGAAFTLDEEWDSVSSTGPPLFPHVATKNIRFEANFGQLETPWYGLPEGYTFINEIPLRDRIRGPVPPASKSDCTVLMMIGLPGCGKTTWVEKFREQNQEQRWHILSAPMVLEHMKVQGVSRKKLTQGRWDVMMGATVKCLNKLMTLACRKKKNYIIDQTNCYPLARKKKMIAFKDFHRKAVVLVPTAETHADRLHRQAMTEGKQMPPEAMLEMKACFTLPKDDDELFDVVQFIGLNKDEAQRVVEHYNEEGKAFKPPEPKKRRGGDWNQQENQQSAPSSRKDQQSTTSASANGNQAYGKQTPALQETPQLQQLSGAPSTSAVGANSPSWSQSIRQDAAFVVDRTSMQQPMAPAVADQPACYQSYHHSYRHYQTFTPRSGWPSNWPQAQWHPQSSAVSSPALSDVSTPAFFNTISNQNVQSPYQYVVSASRGSSEAPTPTSLHSEEQTIPSPSHQQ